MTCHCVLTYCRWKKSLNPMRKKVGKWSPDEDKHLKVAVMLFGAKNWGNIAQFVSGRTKEQCTERYVCFQPNSFLVIQFVLFNCRVCLGDRWKNCLDPSLKRGEWSEDEDSRLKAAIAKHGHRWSVVAACVPPRTDSQCLRYVVVDITFR